MHIKKIAFLLLMLICIGVSAQTGSSIIGKWKGEDQPNNHVQFYFEKDGFYYGKLVSENGKTQNIGKAMMKQLKYDATTNTYKGTMTPPDKNITVNVTLSLIGNDKIKVVAKKFLITKTIYFLRIQ